MQQMILLLFQVFCGIKKQELNVSRLNEFTSTLEYDLMNIYKLSAIKQLLLLKHYYTKHRKTKGKSENSPDEHDHFNRAVRSTDWISRAFRSVSYDTACIIAGIAPTNFLADDCARTYR